ERCERERGAAQRCRELHGREGSFGRIGRSSALHEVARCVSRALSRSSPTGRLPFRSPLRRIEEMKRISLIVVLLAGCGDHTMAVDGGGDDLASVEPPDLAGADQATRPDLA